MASSSSDRSDEAASKQSYSPAPARRWQRLGLIGSAAVIGSQPLFAQVEAAVNTSLPPMLAVEDSAAVGSVIAPSVAAPATTPAVQFSAPATQPAAAPGRKVISDMDPGATAKALLPLAPAKSSLQISTAEPPLAEPSEPQTLAEATPPLEVITPNDVVPDAIPTLAEDAAEYGGVFVDPTDYSVGATEGPDVFISERSTGCAYQASPGTTGCARQAPAAASAASPEGRSVKIGPVSISASGVRFSSGITTAAGRAYYNTIAKPLVELQAGETFVFPLASRSPITSLFGWRLHPIHKTYRFHSGTDLGAPQGTPILATQAGRITVADYLNGYGNTVIMRHGDNTLESRYPHMSRILVTPGEWVEQGEVIGLVGSTGNSTGPHLHFELRQLTPQGWVAINPDEVLRYALANLDRRGPLQALNMMPAAQAQTGVLTDDLKTSKTALDAPPFRPAQPNAQ